jgi:ferrous iron transport protein B
MKTTGYRCLLVGNANSGKSTFFNALTGLSQKTGNFQGVTVEKRVGEVTFNAKSIEIVDLPGSFSLNGFSEDKKVLSRFLMNRKPDDKVLFVMDPLQMERSMQFLFQIMDLNIPIILVLTMKDILQKKNIEIDIQKLSKHLGIPVFLVNPKKGEGILAVKEAICNESNFYLSKRLWSWDTQREELIRTITSNLSVSDPHSVFFILNNALKQLSGEPVQEELPSLGIFPEPTQKYIQETFASSKLSFLYQDELIEKSYTIKKIVASVVNADSNSLLSKSKRASMFDKFLLHPFFGFLFFLLIMALMFQTLFTWSEYPMKFIEGFTDSLAGALQKWLTPGPVNDLLTKGVIGGVGAVLVFIPQIAFLFLFIGLLEESGYMARASFIMDKLMGKFGLSGRAFIPMLSSAACAVPGIMGSRTIENTTERLITILVSPLITCSARYPVYILVIGSVFPDTTLWGFLSLPGLILFSMFILGLVTSLLVALLFRKVYFYAEPSYFILELPDYRFPSLKNVFLTVYQKIVAFVVNAGTIILYVSIILWFCISYPSTVDLQQSKVYTPPKIEDSYAGKFGKFIEPVIQPLGFDWKIGISILTSFAAREVMVSTLSIIYGVENGDENNPTLKEAIQKDRHPITGLPIWTLATGLSVLIFFAYASQCISTLAVVRKETNSYTMPLFLFTYMTVLAYTSSLAVYQISKYFFR